MGENTAINKQSHVKFWMNRKKYGTVSYLLGCKLCIKNAFPNFVNVLKPVDVLVDFL